MKFLFVFLFVYTALQIKNNFVPHISLFGALLSLIFITINKLLYEKNYM